MKWETLRDEEEFTEFLDDKEEVVDLETVEIIFDNGDVTGLRVDFQNGTSLYFNSTKVDQDGCPEKLCVSVNRGERS